ncbi:hypothetical protein TWF696_006404 [Orbilia brochopaga]|uniref:DUF4211 domain-containing protein n=1 Tax=Orbilia brochopaga TaxID=3140254 RepID=A0AAV9UW72_9PEZI
MSGQENHRRTAGQSGGESSRGRFRFLDRPNSSDDRADNRPQVSPSPNGHPPETSRPSPRRSSSVHNPYRLSSADSFGVRRESGHAGRHDSHFSSRPISRNPGSPHHGRHASEGNINTETMPGYSRSSSLTENLQIRRNINNIRPEGSSDPPPWRRQNLQTPLDHIANGTTQGSYVADSNAYPWRRTPQDEPGPEGKVLQNGQIIDLTNVTPSPGHSPLFIEQSPPPLSANDDDDSDAMDYDFTGRLATPTPAAQENPQTGGPIDITANGINRREPFGRRRLSRGDVIALFGSDPSDSEADDTDEAENPKTSTRKPPQGSLTRSASAHETTSATSRRARPRRLIRTKAEDEEGSDTPMPSRRLRARHIRVTESDSDLGISDETDDEPAPTFGKRRVRKQKPGVGEEDLTKLDIEPIEARGTGRSHFHSEITIPKEIKIDLRKTKLDAFKTLVFGMFFRFLFPKNSKLTTTGVLQIGRQKIVEDIMSSIRALYGPDFQAVVDQWRIEFREEMRRSRLHCIGPIDHAVGDVVLCSCCKQRHRVASSVRFFGVPSRNIRDGDLDVILDEPEQDVDIDFISTNNPARFYVGERCIEIIRMHHGLKHWERRLRRWILKSLKESGLIESSGQPVIGMGRRPLSTLMSFCESHFEGWYERAETELKSEFYDELYALIEEAKTFRSKNYHDEQKQNPIFKIKRKTRRERAAMPPPRRPDGSGVAVITIDDSGNEAPSAAENPQTAPENQEATAVDPEEDIYFLNEEEEEDEKKYERPDDDERDDPSIGRRSRRI